MSVSSHFLFVLVSGNNSERVHIEMKVYHKKRIAGCLWEREGSSNSVGGKLCGKTENSAIKETKYSVGPQDQGRGVSTIMASSVWMNNVPVILTNMSHPQVTVHCVTWMGTLPPHIGGHEEDVTLVTQSSVWSFLGSVLCNQLTLS